MAETWWRTLLGSGTMGAISGETIDAACEVLSIGKTREKCLA
jgi:hypothetical protein